MGTTDRGEMMLRCSWQPMISESIRRLAFVLAFCSILPEAAAAQRINARRSGASAVMTLPAHDAGRRGPTDLPGADGSSLGRHALYGALAGAVLWGVYFALPCDGSCDGSRPERFVLLPALAGIGASAGFLTGLLRGAR